MYSIRQIEISEENKGACHGYKENCKKSTH